MSDSFGLRLAAGIAVGGGGALPILLASGRSPERNRIKKYLAQAVAEISVAITDARGAEISVDRLFDCCVVGTTPRKSVFVSTASVRDINESSIV